MQVTTCMSRTGSSGCAGQRTRPAENTPSLAVRNLSGRVQFLCKTFARPPCSAPTPHKGNTMRPLYVMVGLPIALALTVTTAFEASVTPARVEIEIPEPPTLAVIDSQRVLVYEVHITSFARTPLQLLRIEVLGRPAVPLASPRGTAPPPPPQPVRRTPTP